MNCNFYFKGLPSSDACTVYSAVGDKFIHYQSEPVAKRLEKTLVDAELFDGGQQCGLVLFGWRKSELQLVCCFTLFFLHNNVDLLSR